MGYGGSCPECGLKPKAESKNSKIPLSSLMKPIYYITVKFIPTV